MLSRNVSLFLFSNARNIPDSNRRIQAPLKNKNIPKQNSTEFPKAFM